jgi:hypothetical protein
MSHQDRRRIARSKYKLSLVLAHLEDPAAAVFRQQARQILTQETQNKPDVVEDEATYDDMVAHI